MTFLLILLVVVVMIAFVVIVCTDKNGEATKPTDDEIHLQELINRQDEDNNLD